MLTVMKKKKFKKILLTGIPGAGKTTMGDYFRDELGYKHCDLERLCDLDRYLKTGILVDFKKLLRYFKNYENDVVVSWGFNPVCDFGHVKRLRNIGFKLFWLDGNRPAAFRAYIRRGTRSQEEMFNQMAGIEKHRVIERINPIVINPFKNDWSFRRKVDIAREILRKSRSCPGE